ncbi:hypothetical protein [Shewanella sp. NIFS-20-20]|uniref:hypothetical protein n=1 Tax=Shewanella sp. NIFS-20-20 TaxID=2853806 RepID=UPI001C496659|nr:hypothetical protein [Shewanella sp. NIFS-20-20]MBV7317614.1 hypothetical protein [Shewanella sp. NIFS-20-20]
MKPPFTFVIKSIVWLTLLYQLQACMPVNTPNLEDLKIDVLNHLNTYDELADRAILSGITRISLTYNSQQNANNAQVYPKGQLTNNEIKWFVHKFKELGIEIGIQTGDDQVVEILYWSSGILDRGQGVTIVRSEKNIEYTNFYYYKSKYGHLDCTRITERWYVCHY